MSDPLLGIDTTHLLPKPQDDFDKLLDQLTGEIPFSVSTSPTPSSSKLGSGSGRPRLSQTTSGSPSAESTPDGRN